jgi:glycosyltransferase involved in cell wall biosynthesis
MTASPDDDVRQLDAVASRAAEAGIRRVHGIAWRDLDDPNAGGSEIHANEILTRWARAGLDVILHDGAVDGTPRVRTRDGIAVHGSGGPITSWITGPVDLWRSLDRKHDAVLEIWHGVNFFAPFWSRVPTVGIFHHVHTKQFHQVLPPGAAHLAAALERHVYPRAYRNRPLIALSRSVREEMASELGWDTTNVHVVEPGVGDQFRPGGERSPHPLVVSVGRFMPQKGFAEAIDVLLDTKAAVPSLEAVIVGDGPERALLEEKISATGAGEWINLAGYVREDDLVALYQRAWVLLSASRREGWGMTVTEAGACATPAVATDITGHREAVVDGVSGLLAPDRRGLARGVVELLTDDARRGAMGDAARVHAGRYTWDSTARRVFDVLADEARRLRPT